MVGFQIPTVLNKCHVLTYEDVHYSDPRATPKRYFAVLGGWVNTKQCCKL